MLPGVSYYGVSANGVGATARAALACASSRLPRAGGSKGGLRLCAQVNANPDFITKQWEKLKSAIKQIQVHYELPPRCPAARDQHACGCVRLMHVRGVAPDMHFVQAQRDCRLSYEELYR